MAHMTVDFDEPVLIHEVPAVSLPQSVSPPFESLDACEALNPGSIVTPCFDIASSPSDYSILSSDRAPSFSRTAHNSVGCISEIRASTIETETITTVLNQVALSDEDYKEEVFEETVAKFNVPSGSVLDDVDRSLNQPYYQQKQEAHEDQADGTHSNHARGDVLDASFDVTCTSSYLPKNDTALRHAVTTKNLRSPGEKSQEEIDSPVDEQVDYTQMDSWRNQPRQFFILSDSGKPIYSRHGEEDKLVTLCGVMQALISVINDGDGNNLWSMNALDTTVSFLVRSPLVMVTVAKTGESDRQLLVYLNYAYDFIISVLTLPQLSKIFVRYKNFDLRRMLSGTEKILDHLIDWIDEDMGFLLGSVRCLPLSTSLRESINTYLTHSCHKIPGLVFALVIVKRQLISVARLKKYVLHPSDIRLLMNIIDASDSFKTAESWIPICLPKFDSSGFLHAYISYLHDSPVCLVYLGVDPHLFHALSRSSVSFLSKMDSSGDLNAVLSAMTSTSHYSASQSGVPELRHFIYKSTSAAQVTSPYVGHPYIDQDQRKRLRGFYRYLHRKMHCPIRAAKIIVMTSNTELLLGWVTTGFELYAILEPSITKHQAVLAIEKLIKWIKKEEHHLFILSSPVFS